MLRTLALTLALVSAPALAQQGPPIPSITVEGEATISVPPDTALISLGVVTERPGAAEASSENAKAVSAVLEAIRAEGIGPEAVQTAAVDLSAIYDAPSPGTPKITGFRASNALRIRVRPAENAGPLVGKLIDKGVNAIEGIEFVASPDALRQDRLRADAMRDARHQADVYVEALGLKLGHVLAVVPVGLPVEVQPRAFRRMASVSAAAAPMPLAAGSLDQRATVSVTFEIVQ